MTTNPDKTAELRAKNLEMIQGIVTRTAGYSVGLKTASVTLTTAVMGLALGFKSPELLWVSFIPLLGFAYLDARYLAVERRFRAHLREVAEGDWAVLPDFRLEPASPVVPWWVALGGWSVWPFYGLLAAVLILVRIFWRTP